MKTPITITLNIELTNIFVLYKEQKMLVEYITEKEFNRSLQSKPLTSISSIFIPIKLNEFCSPKLTISWDSTIDKWVVSKENQPILNFSHENSEGFMDKFWNELRNIITPPDSPGPDAKYMM